MTDERIMHNEERQILIQMLEEIDPEANYPETLEEEVSLNAVELNMSFYCYLQRITLYRFMSF